MGIHYVKDALKEVGLQVLKTFLGFGLGVVIMGLYCMVILVLNVNYGTMPMLIGSVIFLAMAYFFVDLWWTYREVRRLHKD